MFMWVMGKGERNIYPIDLYMKELYLHYLSRDISDVIHLFNILYHGTLYNLW